MRPLWCQQGPRPQWPYWFSAFIHRHRLGTAPEACWGRSRTRSPGWHLGCSELRRLCGLVLFKVRSRGLGFAFYLFFPVYLHTRVTR